MNNQVKMNETILITIKRLGINGEGIGYYKRLAVFVDNALPGEVVEVKIIDAKEKYATGEIIKYKVKSPHRIEAPCAYYGKCGGCQLQHLAYPEQLKEKKNMVIEAFERYYDGDISKIKFYDTIGMENPWAYRNKSSLPVRHNGEKVVVGMYAKNSNRLIYIDNSLVENDLIEKTRKEILDILSTSSVDIYNSKTHTGSLKYLVIRAFEETGEVQVTFILTNEDKKLINILKKLKVTSANYSINNDPKSIEIFGDQVVNVAGSETIEGRLNDLKFLISPKAFFQLNSKQTAVLYDEIKRACRLKGDEKVLDAYCGIGSIGMTLAPFVKEVRGIDTNREGIADANLFAQINRINNADFYAGNILPYMNQFAQDGFIPDVIVVDPPRKGLELNFINYLQKNVIKKIVYVSCNPSTLAKNLNHLQKEYSIKYVTPVDMFPQTANVECITLLERR
jgi:23S rRNA (uracil-5-)-methyltransferase RumA